MTKRTTATNAGPRFRPATAALAALAGLLAACGDTNSPGAVAPAPPPGNAPAGARRGPGFRDVAPEAGITFHMDFMPGEQGENFKINLYDHGAGVAVADIDGDGDDDVLFLNQLGPNALYANDGSGHFTDVTARAGVALAERICVAAVFGDYDDDGDQDLFVTTTRGGNALFRNDGTGKFEDVTAAAGLTLVAHSEIPAFFDADGDGDLDLFVSGTAGWTFERKDPQGRYFEGRATLVELVESPIEPHHMYRNDGGVFTDVTDAAGLTGPGWGGDVAVFDCDDDGDLDLFVANMFGASRLYRNDGKGRFTDCAKEALGKTSWGAVGAKVFDHDADGRLDLMIIDMHSDMWIPPTAPLTVVEPRVKYSGPEGAALAIGVMNSGDVQEYRDQVRVNLSEVVFGTTLYRNLGAGRYEEVSAKANVETFFPWGAAAGDFDLDGTEDLFIPSGMGYPYTYWRSALLMSRGDGTYADRSAEEGIDPPRGGGYLDVQIGGRKAARSSRAAAVADFDGDGRPDFVVNNYNASASLYRNEFPQRHWISFRLAGPNPGRDAVGALVTIRVASAGGRPARTLVRQVQTCGGYLAQSSRTLHFGLGDADRIDSCEIRWPDGSKSSVAAPRVDAVNDVRQTTPFLRR